MSDELQGWVQRRGWEPEIGEVVIDERFVDVPGGGRERSMAQGAVVDCARYGHFADPYWRARVHWAGGWVEDGVNTCWLIRPDGSQGRS